MLSHHLSLSVTYELMIHTLGKTYCIILVFGANELSTEIAYWTAIFNARVTIQRF